MRIQWLWASCLGAWLLVSAAAQAQPGDFRLLETTIDEVHAALTSNEVTCRQIVRLYLDRIEVYDKKGPALNAIQSVNPHAMEQAEELDRELATSGLVGPLHCVPVLLKDQVETSDMPTTYGSAVFEDFVPRRDATVVIELKKAGAIILAKTTMGEFASRYVGSAFGLIRNAYDPDRNPSGSSGGTAVGVAANFGLVGIGEDTGGSIRGPAAVASLVGLRPTVPLVSRHGMMPARPTSDTLGPMTRTVKDAAILLDVIAGYDPDDPLTAYSVGKLPDSYAAALGTDGLQGARIGVLREPMDPNTELDSGDYEKVREVIDRAIRELGALGAELIDPVTIPEVMEAIDRGYNRNVFETEGAMNGYLGEHENAPVETLREILLTGKVTPWRAAGLLAVVGRSTDESGYLDVVLAREDLRRSVLTLMAEHELDAFAYATFDHQPTPIAPDALTNPKTDDRYGWGNNRYLSPAIGFPALTVPAGFTSDALPVGLEFLGRPFAEAMLLRFAYAYEQATHHRRAPSTTPALEESPALRGER